MTIESIGDTIEDYLLDYWAEELGVSRGGLLLAIDKVGRSAKKVRKHLKNGFRIAIRDKIGVLRKVMRIDVLNDGITALVPYHPETEGWVVALGPLRYDKTESSLPLGEADRYSVSGPVKLSMHLTGFVQFSSSSNHKIISGYCELLKAPKGAGLHAPVGVEVCTGPLFGVMVHGLEDFNSLGNEDAVEFEPNEIWHHPGYEQDGKEAVGYLVEVFQLPAAEACSAICLGNKRTIKRKLPFYADFEFLHELRILELPGMPWCLGLCVCRCPKVTDAESGYRITSPGCRREEDGEFYNLNAEYPLPSYARKLDLNSLDYDTSDSKLGC